MTLRLTATAIAHSNIALIKYWGKLQKARKLPGSTQSFVDRGCV